MEGLIVALAVTLPLIGLFVMLVYLRRMENSEKLSMIEKGVDPSLFARKKRGSSGTLRISLLLIGVGFGFLGGQIWEALTSSFGHDPLPYFTMIFIFGGLGLLIAYLIEEKKDKQAGN
jgi:hypothetical protein